MYINFFSKHFYPENFFINNLVKDLIKKKKYKFKIITGRPYYNYIERDPINLKSFHGHRVFRVFAFKPNNKKFLKIFLNYFTYILNSLFLSIKLITNNNAKCNFVFATSPLYQAIPAILITKLVKIPTIIWVQDLWPEVIEDHGYKNKYLINFLRSITSYIYKSSHIVLVQNYEFKKYISNIYKIKKILVLHNPSPYKFNKTSNFIKNKSFKFAYAGNIGESQNLIEFCKIIKNINLNFEFYIIGSGSEKEKLENYIKKINYEKKFIIKDHMTESQLKSYLVKMDGLFISLKSGKSLSKTLPGKLSMYLSFGKPIFSFAPGAVNQFIKRHNLGFYSKNYNEIENTFLKFYKMTIKEKKYFYKNSEKAFNLFFKNSIIIDNLEKIIDDTT